MLEGRKDIGWDNMNPPSDIAENIPYLPLGINVRQEVGDSVSAIANAGNAENLDAPVRIVRAPLRQPRQVFSSADVRRLAELLELDAYQVAQIMSKPINTIYKWKSILRGHFPVSSQRARKIPKDIREAMPLERAYVKTPSAPSTAPLEEATILLPTAVATKRPTVTLAPLTSTSTPGSLITKIESLSEKFLAAASELDGMKTALQALVDSEDRSKRTRDLFAEFTELSDEIDAVIG